MLATVNDCLVTSRQIAEGFDLIIIEDD
jgi:hypothetical protein